VFGDVSVLFALFGVVLLEQLVLADKLPGKTLPPLRSLRNKTRM
jgi:hypothetical protein